MSSNCFHFTYFICLALFIVLFVYSFSASVSITSKQASNDALQHQVALIPKCLVISYLYNKNKKVAWCVSQRDIIMILWPCVHHMLLECKGLVKLLSILTITVSYKHFFSFFHFNWTVLGGCCLTPSKCFSHFPLISWWACVYKQTNEVTEHAIAWI